MDAIPLRIGAERVTTDHVIEVASPYDGHVVGQVHRGRAEDLERAVATAKRTMADAVPTHERAAILDRAAAALADEAEEFARTIALESAKPITTARGEVARAVDTLRFSAAAARTFAGEVVPMDASSAGEGAWGFTRRVPRGVVAGITPFNFPLNLVLHKLAPSIAAGCAVVLKPASATPLTAHAIVDLLVERAGLPDGWINVVPVPGAEADALVTHDDVAVVSFTGSRDVGWAIREKALRKEVGLELGNNTPVILQPDADLASAARKIAKAGTSFAGQSCISTQRVLVHQEVAVEFEALLTSAIEGLTVGDPLDDDTHVSALIDAGEADRVHEWVTDARDAGARLVTGGDRDGAVLQPTLLAEVTPDMKVSRDEVFGPVLAMQAYGTLDEALELANDTDYGLQAAIWTADIGAAMDAAETLHFGGVLVNEVPTWRADHMPYGGVRDSGNTREGPLWALRDLLTEERLVVIRRP